MSAEGTEVKARRERLGMTIGELAREAGVSRDTLSDLESARKNFTQLTLAKVRQALDRLEDEAGIDAPPATQAEGPREFKFEVIDAEGFRFITQGPVEDAEKLMRQVLSIVRPKEPEKGDETD